MPPRQPAHAVAPGGNVILITGASSGIGQQVALALGRENNTLIITARRTALLEDTAARIRAEGSRCLVLPCDALDESAAQAVVTRAVEEYGRLDIALLNVGEGPAFNMASISAETVKQNMRLNYDSTVNFLVPVIQQMKTQGSGLIAHTNSLAGFLGLPMQGPYSAAKAATRILMDTCRIELAPYGIDVVTVYPGFVATARIAGDGIPHPFQISEEAAAAHVLRALRKRPIDYPFPRMPALLVRLARILPKRVVNALLARATPTEY